MVLILNHLGVLYTSVTTCLYCDLVHLILSGFTQHACIVCPEFIGSSRRNYSSYRRSRSG